MPKITSINGYSVFIKYRFFAFLVLITAIVTATLASLALFNGYSVFLNSNKSLREAIVVSGRKIPVEIADTPAKRQLGLSGRESLKPGTGLLFIFDTSDYHSFWMKDMNFAIDIFWLDENFNIVDSWLNATPASYPKSVGPKQPAKYVLETNPGEIK